MKNSDINPVYRDVFPASGVLRKCLFSLNDPKHLFWNSFYRAAKQIPRNSPVHGLTDWEAINSRRLALVVKRGHRTAVEESEFRALQNVAGNVAMGNIVATNFLLARLIRRLKKIPSRKVKS